MKSKKCKKLKNENAYLKRQIHVLLKEPDSTEAYRIRLRYAMVDVVMHGSPGNNGDGLPFFNLVFKA